MQQELKNIQKAMGITFVFVTHDQEEALSMSDTVVVMSEGRIQQIGTPIDIYNEPQNAFVADFIGESNILDGVMLADYKVNSPVTPLIAWTPALKSARTLTSLSAPRTWTLFPRKRECSRAS